MDATKVTIETTVSANTKKVWDYWNKPEHITKWNFAADDWHCPKAENDLRVGGRLKSRMEAKDGSFGFDFEATYDEVIDQKKITYTMLDGRQATTDFENLTAKQKLQQSLMPRMKTRLRCKEGGWQAILDNFKKYVEGN